MVWFQFCQQGHTMQKKCNKCDTTKHIDDFNSKKNGKFGKESVCKQCRKIYQQNYRLNNKDKIHKGNREYEQRNKTKIAIRKKKYRENNKEKILERNKKWKHKKYHSDINYRIECILRARLHKTLSSNKKLDKTLSLLGCSINEFKKHIEKQFKEGMSWDNWSHETWHIDHIKSISSYDLSDPEQRRECFHYTNLQPLSAFENLRKQKKRFSSP